MQAKYLLAIASCFGVGAVIASGISAVHAEDNVPYYEVAEINVKDQKGYEDSGVGAVREAHQAAGCKTIAGGYNKAQGLVGNPPQNRFLILSCPSKAALDKHWDLVTKWWESEGHKYADFRSIGVDGNTVPLEPGAYYQVVEINVKDQKGYEDSGVGKVRESMTADGGKVIGGGYNKAQSLIKGGEPPANRYLIIQYPNKAANDKHFAESVKPWWEGEGRKYSDFRAIGVEGVAQK